MGGEDANDCKLQIVSSRLRVRTVHVADSTKLDHVNTMTGQKALPAIYTLTRTPTHARIIPRGVLNHTETDLFNGLNPNASYLEWCETMLTKETWGGTHSTSNCLI